MRLTLSCPTSDPLDVEVDAGATIGALRPHLARTTGHPGWASGPLSVHGRALDDTHAAGHVPLVDAAVLRLGPPAVDEALDAVRGPWHIAFVDGPSAGRVVGIEHGPARVRVVHGRVQVRRRTGWRRWRAGRRVTQGEDVLELRAAADARGDATDRRSVADRPVETATWLAPLAGAVALAAVVRQPAFLLAALVVPLVTVAPRALGAARRRLERARSPASAAGGATDIAAIVARSACAAADAVPPVGLDLPWGADGSLAVVGDDRGHARSIVVGTVGSHAQVPTVLRTTAGADWAWCRWASSSTMLPGTSEPDSLVVADRPEDPGELARWRRGVPARHRLLVVVDDVREVPAWCTAVIGAGSGLSAARAEAQLRRAVAARAVTSRADESLPDTVALGDLPDVPPPSAPAVAATWARASGPPAPMIGQGAGGQPRRLELGREGPHVLVGGTTGAGKSELLVTLVLAIALAQPPDQLALLLVDFKGGTGLGPVAGLPHVVDHVTDLDPSAARRLLVGLRAELRRRERLLATAGVRDLSELDPHAPGTPPRLVVVVDELRALVEDVAEAPGALARLAALGRALGVHLVLATQRPAGAVGADLRANIALRIALRVNDDGDSSDLVDSPAAARIDPRTPGRALLRTGDGTSNPVQVARATTARRAAPVRVARRATRWRAAAPAARDDVAAWVAAALSAAGGRRPDVPWLPALPRVVRAAELHEVAEHRRVADDGLVLALSDDPERQRRGVVLWHPDDGHLLAVGGPRSGRTTTLLAVGAAALLAGRTVHALRLPSWAGSRLSEVGGALGTVIDLDEPRLAARLLELLAAPAHAGTPGARPVLLVDGLAAALESLGGVARGAGADRLAALWRGGSTHVGLAASADAHGPALTHAAAFHDRLVLPLPDPGHDVLAGVPRELGGPRDCPGRAVHLRGPDAALCQVALPDPSATAPASAALRLRPLPRSVDLPARSEGGPEVRLGVGGDGAREITLELDHDVLVLGPPGSGRTNALAVIAAGALDAGRAVVVVDARSTPWPVGVTRVDPSHRWHALEPGTVVVVDDVDDLESADPLLGDGLAALVADRVVHVVVSATSAAAAGAYRGAIPALTRSRARLVLDPADPASAELVGPGAAWLADRSRPTGRGALVLGRDAVPLQVYRLPPERLR